MGQPSFATFAAQYGGVLLMPDCQPQGLSIDTRNIAADEMFVAIKGQNFDGHNFLHQAMQKGAAGLVVDTPARDIAAPQWVVEDTTRALGQIAREVRLASTAKVAGITGSTGKTTVKTMLATILDLGGPVVATEGNLNNEIGVPLTVIRLQSQHRFAVVEMGAAQLGDINYLGQIAMPDVALVNNVGVAHLERFGSRKNIVLAKGEIYESLGQEGIAVINLDTEGADHFSAIAPRQRVLFSVRPGCGADIWVDKVQLNETGSQFELCTADWSIQIESHFFGQSNVENALAAAAIAVALEFEPAQIKEGLGRARPVSGRLTLREGLQGAKVFDDSYNANPVSVKAAIKTMKQFAGRSVLVFGDMGELGPESAGLHEEIGAFAEAEGVDLLLGYGELAGLACKSFGTGAKHFVDFDELATSAASEMAYGDVWLIKGSRSMGLDRLVKKLTNSEGSQCSSG
jgi:UDP-N-acetylmuramoyl-tripeptide--D-alanyl-D-alanine ligase